MKPVRMAPRAVATIEDIGQWTTEVFGPVQALAYEDQMLARIGQLAQGILRGQSCRDVIAPELSADLRLVRSGRHFIIYVESAQAIDIIDILHQSADLARRLAVPGPLD